MNDIWELFHGLNLLELWLKEIKARFEELESRSDRCWTKMIQNFSNGLNMLKSETMNILYGGILTFREAICWKALFQSFYPLLFHFALGYTYFSLSPSHTHTYIHSLLSSFDCYNKLFILSILKTKHRLYKSGFTIYFPHLENNWLYNFWKAYSMISNTRIKSRKWAMLVW